MLRIVCEFMSQRVCARCIWFSICMLRIPPEWSKSVSHGFDKCGCLPMDTITGTKSIGILCSCMDKLQNFHFYFDYLTEINIDSSLQIHYTYDNGNRTQITPASFYLPRNTKQISTVCTNLFRPATFWLGILVAACCMLGIVSMFRFQSTVLDFRIGPQQCEHTNT